MSPRADSKVAMEAREWFVRLLDDDVSTDELARWQAWLARSPAHRAAFDRAADAWALAGEGAAARPSPAELAADRYDGSIPVAQMLHKPITPAKAGAQIPGSEAGWIRLARPGALLSAFPSGSRPEFILGFASGKARGPGRRGLGLIAASLAVAVLGGSATLMTLAPAGEAQAITTARAEHKNEVLADGSRVEVGAMTGVQVRLTERRREVKLDRGEAFFHVAGDGERPFVVKTPFGAVRAVGTAFNVDVGEDQLCITVTEGAVIVQPAGLFAKPVRVEAGQRLVADADGVQVAASNSPVSWTQGRLEYRDEPLRAVIEDVNRYAEHPVVLRDPAVGELAYTGTVRLDATGDWARGLPAAFPVAVGEGAGGVTVISSRR
ncbi:MAG TPA: FecR domain-containing protein [Caulobacteraceae bacterium]